MAGHGCVWNDQRKDLAGHEARCDYVCEAATLLVY